MKNNICLRYSTLVLHALLLAVTWSVLIESAVAESQNAGKNCGLGVATCDCPAVNPPPPAAPSCKEGNFRMTKTAIVNWGATYWGDPKAFHLSRLNPADTSIELKNPLNTGTQELVAGDYYISIRSNKMGPGSYWVSGGPELIGEPHITTINGIHYDFQAAGEFVVLRSTSGFELQARMSPISTTTQPGVDPYSGLSACVSINTAVAVRIGKHRVTYQPPLTGNPDPLGLQLRVNGKRVLLKRTGIRLGNDGRITKTADPGGINIQLADRRTVTVTPYWWKEQRRWYLDIVASPIEASGIAGAIEGDDWLPRLSDGRSLGPRPAALRDRFADLYQKFADSWRVDKDTSLFDYARNTSTKTFTNLSWPPEQPSCKIPGAIHSKGVSRDVAERACRKVVGQAHKNCIFDVMATGNIGFAKSYEVSKGPLSIITTHPEADQQ
jgi:hypothetical protein